MLYFIANSRDGQSSGLSTCNTCCCENIKMRPGESNLLTIEYAPWSVPIGWLTSGLEYHVIENRDACPTGAVNGSMPPMNTNYVTQTPVNTNVTVNLSVNASPAGNGSTYDLMPFSGPYSGSVTISGVGSAIYTPNPSFNGYDVFWYTNTDQDGRKVSRSVVVEVGNVLGLQRPPRSWTSLMPHIDVSAIKVNEQQHQIKFPISMPRSCQGCESYRLTIKQPARDCDGNIYEHYMCFEIRCGDC